MVGGGFAPLNGVGITAQRLRPLCARFIFDASASRWLQTRGFSQVRDSPCSRRRPWPPDYLAALEATETMVSLLGLIGRSTSTDVPSPGELTSTMEPPRAST